LSFFDEADEPPQRPPRTQPRRSRPSGSGGAPPGDRQTIQTRRTVAAVVIVIVIILLALLIHSCDVSASNNALKDYSNSVAGIISSSNSTAHQMFADLSGQSSGCSGGAALQQCIDTATSQAGNQLGKLEGLSVPGPMETAHRNLHQTLLMRRDAYQLIASQVEPALQPNTASQAVKQINTGMANLFGSDVTYTNYAAKQMAAALNGAGIGVNTANGVTIVQSQVLPDLAWLDPAFVTAKLGAKVPTTQVNSSTTAPGKLRGHSLDSVSYHGSTLVPGQTATIASSAATFTLNLTNGGDYNENDVQCTVSISGQNDSASSTIPQTISKQSTTCQVTLPTAPTPGTYNVKFGVTPVPGEKNTANNFLTFPIDFTKS
jgi:hypothetical protein